MAAERKSPLMQVYDRIRGRLAALPRRQEAIVPDLDGWAMQIASAAVYGRTYEKPSEAARKLQKLQKAIDDLGPLAGLALGDSARQTMIRLGARPDYLAVEDQPLEYLTGIVNEAVRRLPYGERLPHAPPVGPIASLLASAFYDITGLAPPVVGSQEGRAVGPYHALMRDTFKDLDLARRPGATSWWYWARAGAETLRKQQVNRCVNRPPKSA